MVLHDSATLKIGMREFVLLAKRDL